MSSAWNVWSSHYHESKPPAFTDLDLDPNLQGSRKKRAIQQDRIKQARARQKFRARIKRDWDLITTQWPGHHVCVKTRLRDAIKRARATEKAAIAANTNVNRQAEADAAEGYLTPAKLYEDLTLANINHLVASEDLVALERSIRAPADSSDRTTKSSCPGSGEVDDCGREDEKAKDDRRIDYQSRMPVETPPGGRSWYKHIGTGEHAVIGLVLCGDEHNKIIDRMAVKDVWFTSNPLAWTDSALWYEADDPLRKVPSEVRIMSRLRSAGSSSILRLRGWKMAPEKLAYRMFLEICPHGDAYELALRQITENDMVAEPAIWKIFETLVTAGLVMEQRQGERPRSQWTPVVHLDIKPPNIFIGDYAAKGQPSDFALYPEFKLGDFGHAIDGQSDPGYSYLDRGTIGCIAPEQHLHYSGADRPILNEKTNVYQVGNAIMLLMNLGPPDGIDGDAWDMDFKVAAVDESDPGLVPQFNAAAEKAYSPQLRGLVMDCVRYHQDDRPTFVFLRERIRELTGYPGSPASEVDLAQGARFADVDNLPEHLSPLGGLPDEAQKYRVGMAMPAWIDEDSSEYGNNEDRE